MSSMWTRGRGRWCLVGGILGMLVVSPLQSDAQGRRPQAVLDAVVETARVTPGTESRLSLKVRLPNNVHMQSDKPRDPLLIPTVLTVDLPKGMTLAGISYPKATDLTQQGQKEPLAVFEHEFTIAIRLKLAADVAPGALTLAGHLRYQACDDTTCFPPQKADTAWALNVQPRRR